MSPSGPSFDSEKAGDREVQRTMLELLNQLDGFQPNTQVKVSVGITSQGKKWGREVRGSSVVSVAQLELELEAVLNIPCRLP